MQKTIYTNGPIITMNPHYLQTEAVLVEDGRIQACGRKEDLLQQNGGAQVFDLQGATLMPAFLDSHSHITAFAQTLGCVSLTGAKDFQDITQRIRQFKKRKGAFGSGLDYRVWI